MKNSNARIIKVLLFTFSLIFTVVTLQAQDLKVKVKFDNNEPAGFAYIYLNSKMITTADSTGVALIPMNKINAGDTVSASFVGYSNEAVCITKQIKQKAACDIVLTHNYTIDDVVVVANVDAETLYKKYATVSPFYHYGSINDLAYRYMIKKNNSIIKSGEGSFSLIYVYKRDKESKRAIMGTYAYPDANVKDETSFDKQLIASVHNNISFISQYYHWMFRGGRTKTLKYMGLSDNCHVFTSVAINSNSKTQIVCFFDKGSKHLSHFELSAMEYDANGNILITKESKFYC